MPRRRSAPKIRWYVVSLEEYEHRPLPKTQDVWFWSPVLTRRRITDGVLQDVSEAALPGYVLAGSRGGWRHIEVATGMRLLRVDSVPKALTDWEVERLRRLETVEINVEPQVLEPGQFVLVTPRARSSFAGLCGKFLRYVSVEGGRYARVALDLYGERQRVVQIPADYLEAL
jgi:hypothetical protein